MRAEKNPSGALGSVCSSLAQVPYHFECLSFWHRLKTALTAVDAPLPADNLATDLSRDLSAAQLGSIKAQLDLVLMAIEALTNIGSEAVLTAAADLRLQAVLCDRVGLWRLRQSSPLRKGQGRKKLDVEEARALVLVVCHLSAKHHSSIRQAVAKLEQLSAQNQPPHRAAVLGDYLDNFNNLYGDRMADPIPKTDILTQLSLRLLIDLLFYSAPGGERQLWLALLDRTQVLT